MWFSLESSRGCIMVMLICHNVDPCFLSFNARVKSYLCFLTLWGFIKTVMYVNTKENRSAFFNHEPQKHTECVYFLVFLQDIFCAFEPLFWQWQLGRKDDMQHAAKGPQIRIKPRAAEGRPEPLYMGHMLYQVSYQATLKCVHLTFITIYLQRIPVKMYSCSTHT